MKVLLCYLIGVTIGIIITTLYYKRHKIYGVVDVDHEHGTCIFRINSDELTDRRNTKVILTINHDADHSREEQSL